MCEVPDRWCGRLETHPRTRGVTISILMVMLRTVVCPGRGVGSSPTRTEQQDSLSWPPQLPRARRCCILRSAALVSDPAVEVWGHEGIGIGEITACRTVVESRAVRERSATRPQVRALRARHTHGRRGRGRCRIDELATVTDQSEEDVREHLTTLARDGLISWTTYAPTGEDQFEIRHPDLPPDAGDVTGQIYLVSRSTALRRTTRWRGQTR